MNNEEIDMVEINPVWDEAIGKKLKWIIQCSPIKKCFCCFSKLELTEHHIIPKNIGGTEEESNKITLCLNCHMLLHQSLIIKNKKNMSEKYMLERLFKLKLFKELEKEFK